MELSQALEHLHNHRGGNMERKERLIMKEAPPDTSTYIKGEPGIREAPPKDETGRIYFSDALRRLDSNE